MNQRKADIVNHVRATYARLNPSWTGSLDEKLTIDSLDLMELAFELEEHFGLQIPDDSLSKLDTLRKLANWIDANSRDRN